MATAPTPPDQVRTGLTLVTSAAAQDLQAVATSSASTTEVRSALFVAAPLIVSEYSDGAAALALDWYEELRDAASPDRPYAPVPIRLVTDENVRAVVALSTVALMDKPGPSIDKAINTSLQLVVGGLQELVADAFRDTMTKNTVADPAAAGWRRFARPGACKFCLMLAARGAVYKEATARFAAHGAVMRGKRRGGNCMCIAGPAFGGPKTWTEATPMQYLASRPERDAEDHARLREYLNDNFPDAPG